jgi:AcrR family transcriptional regulator
MSTQTRRDRERADRERLIITAAKDLAESEGWDAVTTRRLATEIEYSQPVLYSHFKSKDAIMAAVAVEGFAELAGQLHAARAGTHDPRAGIATVANAYAAFAERRPALYDAMFTHIVDLPFATAEAPPPLRAGFAELREAVRPVAAPADLETFTETFWAALHGLVTLMRNGRMRRSDHDRRMALLIARFADR